MSILGYIGAVLITAIIVYFLPSLIAILKWKRNKLAVFALNALLGWTFIGWLVALIWALSSENRFGALEDKDEEPGELAQ